MGANGNLIRHPLNLIFSDGQNGFLAISIWIDEESKALAADYDVAKLRDKSRLASELIPAIVQAQ